VRTPARTRAHTVLTSVSSAVTNAPSASREWTESARPSISKSMFLMAPLSNGFACLESEAASCRILIEAGGTVGG
jgi:hypothetical protein